MHRLLLTTILPLLIAAAGWRVMQQFRAAQIAHHQPTPEGLLEAIRLDPAEPGYHFRLGVAYRDVPELRNPALAQGYLETAVELNPYNWRYRRELAQQYELSGQIREAEDAFLRAVEISPRNGSYRWRLANFYLRHRSIDQAVPQLKLALAADHSLLEPGLRLLLKVGATDEQLGRFWPDDHEARRRLMRLLCQLEPSPGRPPSQSFLRQLWDQWLAGAVPTQLVDGQVYIDRLIAEHRSEEARARWIELTNDNHLLDPQFELERNLIWNGEFEWPFAQAGLGWWTRDAEGYTATRAEAEGHDGSGCLRIAFDGSLNLSFTGVWQRVIVGPGRSYRLTFRARTQDLVTDQGVFFDVRDGATDKQLLETEQLLGSMPWTSYAFDFVAESPWIRFLLRRDPSRRFDNQLSGNLWIDSMVLEETNG